MKRELLTNLLHEVTRITGERLLVMVGSQAVHAVTDEVPAEVVMSRECVLLDEGDPVASAIVALGPSAPHVRCLEIHDLLLSKLAAGRLKDYELVAVLLDLSLAEVGVVRERIAVVPDLQMRAILLARLQIVLESAGR